MLLPMMAGEQIMPDKAIQTTVCEVVRAPELFNGKMITLRGPIQIGLENFGLSASE